MVALALAAKHCKGHKGMHYKDFGARLHTLVTQQEPWRLVRRAVQHTCLEALPHMAMQHTELGVWLRRATQHMPLGVFARQQD